MYEPYLTKSWIDIRLRLELHLSVQLLLQPKDGNCTHCSELVVVQKLFKKYNFELGPQNDVRCRQVYPSVFRGWR